MENLLDLIIIVLFTMAVYFAGKDAGYHRALKELANGDLRLNVNVIKENIKVTKEVI